ncbi:MAG: helix-turn-helix domain-containing protein [Mesonia hippocampi]|uniref:AraC-like DNA-binding protein n=1 Tax=Mesonia hippocampi TaxID=1628250 RepID=A0A840EN48_9FLAO|nr:helix-turn-helix domain-containing protein [Mesonia hippocampi]MBB4118491.1 AraC-like DNA-binding protein [Mesonia hippocampi]
MEGFGSFYITNTTNTSQLCNRLKDYYKIIFLEKGSKIKIDFDTINCPADTFFFLNEEHFFVLDEKAKGQLIYFDTDFYCIELHDQELACDGLLYRNITLTPYIHLTHQQATNLCRLVTEIEKEEKNTDYWSEEKIKLLLKYIIIEATRIWAIQWQINTSDFSKKQNFIKKFSKLVEENYAQIHQVTCYAKMLNITPKTLNNNVVKNFNTTPQQIISNRIILQAKRLLAHTNLSVKEISHTLGYTDSSYFNRFFKKQTSTTPLTFRKTQKKPKQLIF